MKQRQKTIKWEEKEVNTKLQSNYNCHYKNNKTRPRTTIRYCWHNYLPTIDDENDDDIDIHIEVDDDDDDDTELQIELAMPSNPVQSSPIESMWFFQCRSMACHGIPNHTCMHSIIVFWTDSQADRRPMRPINQSTAHSFIRAIEMRGKWERKAINNYE